MIKLKMIIIGLVNVVIKLQFGKQKNEVNKKREIENTEKTKIFQTHFAEAQNKFADDKNVTFDYPYIHILLKEETISLLSINPANTEQLLLMQKDHLQITCDLKTFWQYLAFMKASGKYSANSFIAELPVKIGIGLWEFQKGKTPEMFPLFIKRQIIAGNIYIWNLKRVMYETEMMNSEIKTAEGCFISQNERYCCGGIEIFKYPSCFY